MSFDSALRVPVPEFRLSPARSAPSLERLAFILRRPSLWPEGFVWNYSTYRTCAVGLAEQLWMPSSPTLRSADQYQTWMALTLRLSPNNVRRIFVDLVSPWSWRRPFTKRSKSGVTPEMVAREIEAHLAA